ncbi:MAG: ATP-binding cassette domain-containing protein [Dehalococcoidia bacterium]|nr:ATP-binding cassette domain-containing protein [Dehalococcoidia bacterium]
MSLLSLQDIEVAFGAEDVLTGVSGDIEAGDRIGLVGRNGAGKTTLLHVMTGELRPDAGKRHAASRVAIGMVEQVPRESTSRLTVYEEALTAFAEVRRLEQALEEAAHRMSTDAAGTSSEYSDLQDEFEARGGYLYRTRFAQVLTGLGLPEPEWSRPVYQLSGGERSRLALAKALLSQPDLLILDEPTNHLDIDAMRWLDDLLSRWPGTLLITSHDRYFLDKVATRIWLLENGRAKTYRGNYSKFEQQRSAELDLLQKQAQAQQEYIAREESFIRRYRAGQRAREAQGRLKKLQHIDRIEAPRKEKSTHFSLSAKRSGDVVLATKDLSIGYGTEALIDVGTLEVERGQRIALIGANGSGKTTLLKTIAGEMGAVAGSLRKGSHVAEAHYWQEAENLSAGNSVFEELRRGRSMDPQIARDILGRFLFSGDDVSKQVSALSGGERSRLALAKLMLLDANFLLLDEPTNHLDIPARDSLLQALEAYSGTIVFVSHDRRLIADLATSLWRVENGRLYVFEGSFEEYNESLRAQPSPPPAKTKAVPAKAPPSAKSARIMQAAITAMESEIEGRERQIEELGHLINTASAESDHQKVGELGRRFDELQSELQALMKEWAELVP